MHQTLIIPTKHFEDMMTHYEDHLMNPVPHSVFRAKINGVTITAYQSGKVLFQGKNIETETEKWMHLTSSANVNNEESDKKEKQANHLPDNFSQWTIIGNDEVGNGSYFGALTVASCYLPKEKQELIQALGVKDSKNLIDTEIQELAWQIKETIPYALTICNPIDYNRGVKKLNANGIKVSLHNFTLQKLIKQLNDDQLNQLEGVLIDQFTSEANYYKYLKNEKNPYRRKTYFAQKGESEHLAVACASIIARDAFLTSLEELGKPYGITLPSGANPHVDQLAAQLIKKHGIEVLEKTAKLHFKNTEKAKKIASN